MNYKIINGNNIDVLKQYPDNHFDSIVTDPPYGISFLGKDWDSFRNSKVTKNSIVTNLGSGMRMTTRTENYNFQIWCEEWAKECLRVLKPGGYMLSFCAARMYHRMTVGLEDAGFEIRDQIMWIYGSGFPKSQDIGKQIQKKLGVKETKKIKTHDIRNNGLLEKKGSVELEQVVATDPEAKEWSGWGTQLKPAHEPICMARKPMKQTIAKNCQEWGVGALNIDVCRVPYEGDKPKPATFKNGISYRQHTEELYEKAVAHTTERTQEYNDAGRFPANVIHDGSDEVVELFSASGSGNGKGAYNYAGREYNNKETSLFNGDKPQAASNYNDSGSAARFFYCPKVNRKERHVGFDEVTIIGSTHPDDVKKHPLWEPEIGTNPARLKAKVIEKGQFKGNNHPTVKPVELMKYLIKLVTPNNGKVLDPFCGSGSTGMAAVELGHEFVGCDLDPNYCKIAEARIVAWNKKDPKDELFDELFDIDTDNDENR